MGETRSSPELGKAVLEHMLEGFQIIAPNFTYLYANAAAARHGRSTPSTLIGRKMGEVYPGIEDTEMFALLRLTMADRVPREMENEFEFPDGERGWFSLRFEPVPTGVAILSVDVTNLKRTERALRRSNRALRCLGECNQKLIRAEDEESFVAAIERIIVERGGYENASFRPLVPARAGTKAMDDDRHEEEPATDPPPPDGANTLSFPVTVEAERMGDLHVTSRDPESFDDEERALLGDLALDLGFGIQTLRTRSRRVQADDLVHHASFGVASCRMIFQDGRPVDFVYLDVNPAFAALSGIENAAGRRISELVPGILESDPELFERYGRVARGEGAERFETYVKALDDWYQVSAFSPKPEHFVSVFDVITDKKKAELGLKTFSRHLEGLANVVQELSRTRSVDDVIRIVRKAARELVDADGATFVFRDGDLCHYVDEDAIAPLWKGRKFPMSICMSGWAMLNREPAVIPDIFRDERIPIDAYAPTFVKSLVMVPIRRSDPIGAIGTYWARTCEPDPGSVRILQALADSTAVALENVRILDELQSSKARTRSIYDHLPTATYVWFLKENRFVLEDFNRAARQALSEGSHLALGMEPSELRPAFADLDADLRRCLESGDTLRRETTEIGGPDHESRIFVLTAGAIPDDRVLLHVEDVTQQRKTEKELRISQKLDAVGRLAGGVAHDFNNLLSVILNYAEMATDHLGATDQLRRELEAITDAGERAAALTRQLLAFSRKQMLDPVNLDLNEVIRGMEPLLRRLLGEDLSVVVDLAPELGTVRADPSQIEQVLLNLAVNARDAMPRGGTLSFRTRNVSCPPPGTGRSDIARDGVLLEIRDTGFGMDDATREQIFDPFFTTKAKGKGTGLGLATVYGIVTQSGGHIDVRNPAEGGTCFEIILPRETIAPSPLPSRSPATAPAPRDATLLVVEDEPAVLDITERILRREGYHVLKARNGGEALLHCQRHEGDIDLLLTDVIMPQMSGPELAVVLHRIRPALKVLYMSGYTDDAIARHGLLEDGTEFLPKPFRRAELCAKVRAVLDG